MCYIIVTDHNPKMLIHFKMVELLKHILFSGFCFAYIISTMSLAYEKCLQTF